jgi:hypothetical protein
MKDKTRAVKFNPLLRVMVLATLQPVIARSSHGKVTSMNKRRSCSPKYLGATIICDDVSKLHTGEVYYLISGKDGWKFAAMLAADFMKKQKKVQFD